ncbi:uncharacterized protein LOC135124026 [Zophobas morio]|uniref:uncharacterized protein LOC135124026 n=1 Tax=Zophobas morio TaxID=2755281 RepID=UPI003082FF3C
MATTTPNTLTYPTTHEFYVIIRSAKNGMVLTAGSDSVSLQEYNPSSSRQLWSLQNAPRGKVILNAHHGKVLDVQGGASMNHRITLSDRTEGKSQYWNLNSDGTITSPGTHLALDVTMLNKLKVWSRHGRLNQRFAILKTG